MPDFQIIFLVPNQLPKFSLTRASRAFRSHRKIIEMKKQLVFVVRGIPPPNWRLCLCFGNFGFVLFFGEITIQMTKKYCTDVDSGVGGFRRVAQNHLLQIFTNL